MELFRKLGRKPVVPQKIATKKQSAPEPCYRGVQVQIDEATCCQAAREVSQGRYLSTNAPLLPLADCDASSCTCVYRHFDDRRTDVRRASDTGFDYGSEYCTDEKRKSLLGGRRTED